MYSKEITDFLKKKRIKAGDRINAEYSGVTIEGELMPKTEAGSPDTVIVKLKSGYNIGIRFDSARIKKIADSEGAVSFPKARLKHDPELPKVTIIYTGGTIGSRIDYRTGAVEESKLSPEELLYTVPEISKIARISMKNPFSIPSEDMTYKEWGTIAKEVADELNSGARGVIITMGTDTMHYTAAALSFMLQDLSGPVVITGAQRSPDRGSSDAFINLICAAQAAAKSDIAEVGICMHKSSSDDECQFMRGTKVRKMHSSRRDAFRPINSKPIAYVTADGDIRYDEQYNRVSGEKTKVVARTDFYGSVALVKVYPNADPSIIDFYVDRGFKGIILEGEGLGHTPTMQVGMKHPWLDRISNATKRGVIVGMTTQCVYGRVNPNVYTPLRRIAAAGAVYCEDMLAETAYVKLGWLLGNYSAKKARELLPKNIAGEISLRTDYDDFLV